MKQNRTLSIGGAIVLVTTAYSAFKYATLPDRVGVHFNARGDVDRYGSKLEAVALCVAGPEDDFRNQMNRQSKKYETAMLKKDIKAFGKLLDMYTTKNFVYKENGQSMTKKQMFDQMSMSVKGFQKVTKFKSRILTAQVQGERSGRAAAGPKIGNEPRNGAEAALASCVREYQA